MNVETRSIRGSGFNALKQYPGAFRTQRNWLTRVTIGSVRLLIKTKEK